MRPGVKYMLMSTGYFALMNVCVKFISHIPAHEVVFFRCFVSFILSYIYLRRNHIPLFGNNKTSLLLRGIFGMASLTAFFTTLQHMPLASAISLQYLSPIFTIVFAIFILKEKVKPLQWLFFAISFAGVMMVRGFDYRVSTLYLGLGLFSAVFSGLAYNMIRQAGKSEHPVVIVFYFPLVALPIISLWCLYDWVNPYGWDWFYLIATGILTQLAQVSMTRAYQEEEPANISVFQYSGLIYALFLGYVFFDETYTLAGLGGMLVIALGMVMSMLYARRRKRVESRRKEGEVSSEV